MRRLALLLPLLLVGCAGLRPQVEENTAHIKDVLKREAITLEALELLMAYKQKMEAWVAAHAVVEKVSGWGQCEEHGEPLAVIGWSRRRAGDAFDSTPHAVLLCPHWHYTEREIEGPKEKSDE